MTSEVIATLMPRRQPHRNMEGTMHGFWKNWMTLWCCGVLAFLIPTVSRSFEANSILLVRKLEPKTYVRPLPRCHRPCALRHS